MWRCTAGTFTTVSRSARIRALALASKSGKLAREAGHGMKLPDIELVAAEVHSAWMETKRSQGVTSRKDERGDELMVPYGELSELAKELDRSTVRAVYAAIERLGL